MSLRSRILALYVALALIPMLIVAAGNYVQAMKSLTGLVHSKLAAASEQGAAEVVALQRELRSSLMALARSDDVKRVLPGAEPMPDGEPGAGSGMWALLGPAFESVVVLDAQGSVLREVKSTAPGSDSRSCEDPGVTPVEMRVPVPGEAAARGGELVGRARPQALIPQEAMRGWFGRNGQRLVVHRETGAVVFDARCALGQGLSARTDVADWKWTATAAGRGRVELLEGGIAKVGAYAEAASVPWLVVSLADMQEFTGEYRREQLLYLVFVIFVVVAAGGAFLILAQEVMGSLEDLTVAAERIGEGELTPWLPPPGPDETGRLSLAISLMLARIKAMLRQNEVARRLAVAGEVASQLSHEIRNPLSSIRLNLQSLDRETRSGTVPSDLSQVVRLCLREINRLDNAVSSVLTLGQPMPPELAPCSLGEVVRESLAVLEPRLRARSIVAHADVSSADRILGDEGQLRGVFLNLFLNAVDAMPAGGVLRVWLDHGTGPAGEEVRVHVRDGGEGIRPELRHLVFEPFFTTKASGSGIGLTLARHTVEAHHGRLYLDVARDAEGAGAEFVAAFPPAAGEPDGREAAGRDVGRRETVRVEA